MLLGNENQLFEFRALGGQVSQWSSIHFIILRFSFHHSKLYSSVQVELSVREDIIYIGTLLKSLEILDQYQLSGVALPRYLARSFINTTNEIVRADDQSNQADNEDKFFEAADELDDVLYPVQRSGSMSEYFAAIASPASLRSSMKPPSFERIPGLIPNADITTSSSNLETTDIIMDSFVKAQMLLYGHDSPHYNNLDNRVRLYFFALNFF